mgnify:CR=1 FL=1
MNTVATFNALGRNRHEFRSATPLSDAQIRQHAPSIFAAHPHDSRSERYAYIPTGDILQALRREGFEAYQCGQSRTRDASKQDYTRHQLRLRHASQQLKAVNDETFEIVLLNSHDGSSSYQMYAGALRLVCTNGLVVGRAIDAIKMPHKGQVADRVIEGAFRVLDQMAPTQERIETMKAETLSEEEQHIFAQAALALRWEEGHEPVDAAQLNTAVRREDQGADLWRSFNRVQENLVRGGQRGHTLQGRRTTTRPIIGIEQNVGLNRALWTLAEELQRLRAA